MCVATWCMMMYVDGNKNTTKESTLGSLTTHLSKTLALAITKYRRPKVSKVLGLSNSSTSSLLCSFNQHHNSVVLVTRSKAMAKKNQTSVEKTTEISKEEELLNRMKSLPTTSARISARKPWRIGSQRTVPTSRSNRSTSPILLRSRRLQATSSRPTPTFKVSSRCGINPHSTRSPRCGRKAWTFR